MEAPNYSNNPSNGDEKLKGLLNISTQQHQALISLREVMTQLSTTLSEVAKESLTAQIKNFTAKQNDRFNEIDELINDNILRMKKGKTADNTVFLLGKEFRKVEASIRTIKLFLCDVVEMLAPNSVDHSRVEDRLSYASQRLQITQQELDAVEQRLKTFIS